MNSKNSLFRLGTFLFVLVTVIGPAFCNELPSWNDTAAKREILNFVERTTTEGSPDYLPRDQRISVFDNDGTLICEQPIYIQFAFALNRVKELAPTKPEWINKEPFTAALDGRMNGNGLTHEDENRDFAKLVWSTSENQAAGDLAIAAWDWLDRAENPSLKKPYQKTVYLPMRELLEFLRSKGFQTYIVSGGGSEFVRAYSQKFYGIPPEQIIGSQAKMVFVERNGRHEVVMESEPEYFTNGPAKPFAIVRNIGKRPVLAFGNSDGDLEMLLWTTTGGGPRLGLLLHHDDEEREFAYDRASVVGRLDKALDEAKKRSWRVVSMKNDWKQVFP